MIFEPRHFLSQNFSSDELDEAKNDLEIQLEAKNEAVGQLNDLKRQQIKKKHEIEAVNRKVTELNSRLKNLDILIDDFEVENGLLRSLKSDESGQNDVEKLKKEQKSLTLSLTRALSQVEKASLNVLEANREHKKIQSESEILEKSFFAEKVEIQELQGDLEKWQNEIRDMKRLMDATLAKLEAAYKNLTWKDKGECYVYETRCIYYRVSYSLHIHYRGPIALVPSLMSANLQGFSIVFMIIPNVCTSITEGPIDFVTIPNVC